MTTLSLVGGTVVTSLSPPAVVRGDVTIEDGRIAHVGTDWPPDRQRLDCRGCLVIPGLVCAHHHLYSSLARGMPYALEPPTNFVEILRRVWWRLDRALDAESTLASAWVGAYEALLAGTTTIVDHHASPSSISESLGQVLMGVASAGARSILCYEVSDRDGAKRAEEALAETRRFGRAGPLVRTMVGAHASFTLSDETLAACVDLARDLDTGIHIHVAEDGADQRDALARFGKRVVPRLVDAGVLDERALLAHCIHLDDDEIAAVNASGATSVHNPRSNMSNGVGRARVGAFERLALGTDGISGDMFAEAQAGYWRARETDLGVSPQWALDRLGESARFAGSMFDEPLLGRVVPGAPADVIVVEYDPPTELTAETLASHFVFGLASTMVRHVLVAGGVVVHQHRLSRPPPWQDGDHVREAADGLWRRMAAIPEHPFVPEGG
jgi:putative selenium metabolism protein SsnA